MTFDWLVRIKIVTVMRFHRCLECVNHYTVILLNAHDVFKTVTLAGVKFVLPTGCQIPQVGSIN